MTTLAADRENQLKMKRICRFCCSQQSDKLTPLYARDLRVKASASLPLQVMAIASMEVYDNDGMPGFVCLDCRILFEHSYRFKQMCKQADTLLRQYPLTGLWPQPLEKPRSPMLVKAPIQQQMSPPSQRNIVTIQSVEMIAPAPIKQIAATQIPADTGMDKKVTVKKLLNSAPVPTPEPPVPLRLKTEENELDAATIFLNKVENDEELSMDDVKLLLGGEPEFITDDYPDDSITKTVVTTTQNTQSEPKSKKPKLLNKSSMRILNKDANAVKEPRLRRPQITCDEDGNAVIVTEILGPNDPYDAEAETDPIKNAAPVETNVFPCPYCNRSFPLRQLRDIHLVNHNRERRFKCPECEKSFFSKYDLQKHSLTHTGEKPFKCHVCEKSFTRSTLLHRHEKTHTDIPKFICIHCEKPFISRAEMEKHAERHQKNRPFKCKICKKSFAFKQGLERHEITHSTDLPYPCQYCNESFFTPGKLARHLTAHAGKRAYPCKYCPKSYLLSHHLSRHMRSHHQSASSFNCNMCSSVVKTFIEFVDHSTVHALDTLVCPLCKMNIKGNVSIHMSAHYNAGPFDCEYCDLYLLSEEQWREHTKQEHLTEIIQYKQPNNTEENNEKFEANYVIEDLINDDGEKNLQMEDTTVKSEVLSQSIDPLESQPPKKVRREEMQDTDLKPALENMEDTEIPQQFGDIESLPQEKNITQSINDVLKTLPKSVSVQRSNRITTKSEKNKERKKQTTGGTLKRENGTSPKTQIR